MARIAEAELEQLKASVPVAGLVEASGVKLTWQGADLAGLCPFHTEDTPSLKVTPGKNLWHCFGCGTGGGPLDWVMKRRGVSFRHAVELLREDAGLADTPATATRSSVRTLESPVSRVGVWSSIDSHAGDHRPRARPLHWMPVRTRSGGRVGATAWHSGFGRRGVTQAGSFPSQRLDRSAVSHATFQSSSPRG